MAVPGLDPGIDPAIPRRLRSNRPHAAKPFAKLFQISARVFQAFPSFFQAFPSFSKVFSLGVLWDFKGLSGKRGKSGSFRILQPFRRPARRGEGGGWIVEKEG
jgi:hypothetical protein